MININTKKINREKNFSVIIYEELKIITLPDTSLTNLIKYSDIESIIKVKWITDEEIFITSHSIITSNIFIIIIDMINIIILFIIIINLNILLKKEKIFIIYITYIKVSYWSYEKDLYL